MSNVAVTLVWLISLTIFPTQQSSAAAESLGVSAEDRGALISLYEATQGRKWMHQGGWLGPPGSECHWYGVVCETAVRGAAVRQVVADLDLENNGLAGEIPPQLGKLAGLKRLNLSGNAVNGPLPDRLLRLFDKGQLIVEPLSLINDVQEIVFTMENPSLRCSGYQVSISDDGHVRMQWKHCSEHGGAEADHVYCEHRQGKTYDFDRLGRFLTVSGFFAEQPIIPSGWNDVTEAMVTAKRRSGATARHSIDGRMSLYDWSLIVMLEGIIAHVEWAGPGTKVPCSSK